MTEEEDFAALVGVLSTRDRRLVAAIINRFLEVAETHGEAAAAATLDEIESILRNGRGKAAGED